jgi:M6 family metalloprotease-like protein
MLSLGFTIRDTFSASLTGLDGVESPMSIVTYRSMVQWSLVAVVLMATVLPASATMPPATGPLPEAVSEAFADGRLQLPPHAEGLATSAISGVFRVPVILAGFSDEPLTYSSSDFASALLDTLGTFPTGSVQDYFDWASRGRLRVIAEVVATVTLPNTRSYYGSNSFGLGANNTPENAYGAVRDAIIISPRTIDWNRFDRDRDGHVDILWLVHAGQPGEATLDRNAMWSITSGTGGWRNGGPIGTPTTIPGAPDRNVLISRFSILPEMSGLHPSVLSEIGVYCHEFGHALGLPDLYDTSALGGAANAGPGNWSLMATGGYGSNGVSPESPSHLGAWPIQFLGWDQTIRPQRDTTLTLEPLSSSGKIIDLWFEGEKNSEHFLIENRQRGEKFDKFLPSEGLIVYQADDFLLGARTPRNSVNNEPEPALLVVEGDGDSDLRYGINRGDGSDPLPGSLQRTFVDDETVPNLRTFKNAVTQVAIADIERLPADMVRLRLQVRAPYWQSVRDHTPGPFDPIPSYGPAVTSGVDDRGVSYVVRSEWRGGRPQIFMMSSADAWSETFQVSSAPTAAFEPTLAVLPGGDLAIVWTDIRGGIPRLFFRSRIAGVWTAERLLANTPSLATSPAIAADDRGVVSLAFLGADTDTARVHFMQFTYRSPIGRSRPVSPRDAYPSLPAVAVSPTGVAHAIWSQRTPLHPNAPSLWFVRNHPDSGNSIAMQLTPPGGGDPSSLCALTDDTGTLHVIWVTSGPGSHLLKYHRRTQANRPSPRDTILESRGLPIQSLSFASDRHGTLHLAYEAAIESRVEARYRRWRPDRGWDAAGTLINDGIGGNAFQPAVLPRGPLSVSVAFIGYPGIDARFMVRTRTDGTILLDAPSEVEGPRAGGRVGPNPLMRGRSLDLVWSASVVADRAVDLYDIAGRRLATLNLEPDGENWRARASAATTRQWTPGVYFARPRAPGLPAVRWVVIP